MPLSISNTVIAKVLVAWIMFVPAIVLYSIIFYMLFEVFHLLILYYILLSIIITLNGSLAGIIFDVFFPVLMWKEEQELFKGRTAILSFHVCNSLYAAFVFLGSYGVVKFFSGDLKDIFITALVIMLIFMYCLDVVLSRISKNIFQRLNQYSFKHK